MAFIATIKALVDETDESALYDGLNEMFRAAQSQVDEDSDESPWLVDWKFVSVESANELLNDSIANGTYAEGDAFNDWVIFSRSEAAAQDGAGFWSNEHGWTTLDVATRFDSTDYSIPASAGMDAVWMLAPNRMSFYRMMLLENPEDPSLDQTPIAFECFAEDYRHAVEQAENAYPGCRVLGTEDGRVFHVCPHCSGHYEEENGVGTQYGVTICDRCADGGAAWAALDEWKASASGKSFRDWMRESAETTFPGSLAAGDEVWWEDPDDGISSGYYRVVDVRGDSVTPDTVVVLKNDGGSEVEAFVHELR